MRCCRWLLIAHESAQARWFPMTHETLAMMLGVQRSGVSSQGEVLAIIVAALPVRAVYSLGFRQGQKTA